MWEITFDEADDNTVLSDEAASTFKKRSSRSTKDDIPGGKCSHHCCYKPTNQTNSMRQKIVSGIET